MESEIAYFYIRSDRDLCYLLANDIRNDDLTSVCHRHDTGGTVHLYPGHVGVASSHLSGMQPHPDRWLASSIPLLFRQGKLCVNRCLDPLGGGRKECEYRVSNDVYFFTAVRVDGVPQQLIVPEEHLVVDVGVGIDEACGSLDVGEEHANAVARRMSPALYLGCHNNTSRGLFD